MTDSDSAGMLAFKSPLIQTLVNAGIAGVDEILSKLKPLRRPEHEKKVLRYSKVTPNERVQMTTSKIAAGIYQYPAVEDCICYQVTEVSPIRTTTIISYSSKK
jgi:hypothetical protein